METLPHTYIHIHASRLLINSSSIKFVFKYNNAGKVARGLFRLREGAIKENDDDSVISGGKMRHEIQCNKMRNKVKNFNMA